jgi:archaellum biogenesis protein FlaJ (TadC family)
MIFLSLIAGLLVGFCIIRPLLKNTGSTAQTAATINQMMFDAMDDEQKQRVLAAKAERDRLWREQIRKQNERRLIVLLAMISIMLIASIVHHIAPTKPTQAAASTPKMSAAVKYTSPWEQCFEDRQVMIMALNSFHNDWRQAERLCDQLGLSREKTILVK